MDVRPIELVASDGYHLRATLYDANGSDALVVSSALGVPRRYYDSFAKYLAEHGTSVVTMDNRGIGESKPASLRGFEATLAEFGRLDLVAAIDYATRELKPRTLALVGHSAGGQIPGLAPNINAVDRFVFVAAQAGQWRHWPGIRAYGLGALWLAMPFISRVIGYFPSRTLGLGSENLPRGVATEWSKWGRHRDYLFGHVPAEDIARYESLRVPILSWSFADDFYAPRPAVEALLVRYSGASIERRHLGPIGIRHFGFFRRNLGEPLWEETRQWLSASSPAASAATPA